MRTGDGPYIFARDPVTLKEALDGAVAEPMAPIGQRLAQLLDGDVGRLRQHGQDQLLVRLDACRAPVAAQGLRPGIALLALQSPPAADARGADAKPFARLTVA